MARLRLQLTLGCGATVSAPAEWLNGHDDPGFKSKSYFLNDYGEFIRLPNGLDFILIQDTKLEPVTDMVVKKTLRVAACRLSRILAAHINWHEPPAGYAWEQCLAPEFTLHLEGLV